MNELAVINPGSILTTIGKVKWTNSHDCPTGYEWNEDGWIQTDTQILQVSVNMLPYMLNKIGEQQLLYQNLIALRYLNNKGRVELTQALDYKFKMSYFKSVDPKLLKEAVAMAYDVTDLNSILITLSKDIFKFHDVWYSRDCTFTGRKQIQALIRQEYIERSRELMSIGTKYKTEEIMNFADVSKYAVDKHWKLIGLDKTSRTGRAIAEAVELLLESNELVNITQEMVAEIAGISRRTLNTHLQKQMDKI